MKAFGYEVKGSRKLTGDLRSALSKGEIINWNLFNTGDSYYTRNCDEFEVKEADHKNKIIVLKEI